MILSKISFSAFTKEYKFRKVRKCAVDCGLQFVNSCRSTDDSQF